MNLPDWDVTHVEETPDYHRITAHYRIPPTSCPKCHSSRSFKRYGTVQQDIHDLPTLARPSLINVVRQRYECVDCSAVFAQPLPDLHEHGTMTKRLVIWICRQALRRTFTSIAEDAGVTEGTVRNLFKDYMVTLEKHHVFITPEVLGIDELHLLREPRCILTNVKEHCIIGLLPKRTKDVVSRFLMTMPQKHVVKYVCMDMWSPYRDAARDAFPQATIVVDKYHVLRLANLGVERIRKDLRASLTPTVRRGLMHDRFILLKRRRHLDDREALLLDVWLNSFPELRDAYELKEEFYDIWDTAADSNEARVLYEIWISGLTAKIEPVFRDLKSALTNWNQEIFAYFDHRVTNAYTEALNGLAKMANRLGRGYSFDVIRAKMLFNDAPKKWVRERESLAYYFGPKFVANVDPNAEISYGTLIATLTRQLARETSDEESTTNYE
jgi:transposase